MEINKLDIASLRTLLDEGELTAAELAAAYRKAYEAQPDINAYLEFFSDAEEQAAQCDKQKKPQNPLHGIGGAIKDNFAIKGRQLSCASKILNGYTSPYTAVAVQRLEKQGFVNLGRLNLDELAMGATGRLSAFGPVLNPLDKTRLAGGSSSGSAAAVAGGMAAFALGSDTGGSCRLPASYTGICGFKPTYGAIPRAGLTAFAPSLDVAGILARTPADIGFVLHATAGASPEDESSRSINMEGLAPWQPAAVKGLRVACFSKLAQKAPLAVLNAFMQAKELLQKEGAVLEEADLGLEDYLLKMYYAICCSEAASSLSRLDGARYGLKLNMPDIETMFKQTRTQGFGEEARRRILLGNYFLKAENYNLWYGKASAMRIALKEKTAKLEEEGFQIFLMPGFNEAPPIDTPEEDTYASDLAGVFANLSGEPALALPIALGSSGLPVSVQLSGPAGNDALVLRIGQTLYQNFNR